MAFITSSLGLNVLAAHSQHRNAAFARDFREGMQRLVAEAERRLRREHPSMPLRLHPQSGAVALSALNLERCAFAVIDISEFDEEIASLVGVVRGARIPCAIVHAEGQQELAAQLKWAGGTAIAYRELTTLLQGDGELFTEVSQALVQAPVLHQLVHALWMPPDTKTIWVVCPQIKSPGEFANRASLDYTYLDNLGDTDALLEVMGFLSRFYPSATIEKFSADDLPRGHVNSNLVVIGGPGTEDGISNRVCREMMLMVGACVSYSADCDRMVINLPGGPPQQLTAETQAGATPPASESQFSLRRDYGYFARFPNPLNADAAVVLINGIHTAGVLGAARAFGDRREAVRNFHQAFQQQSGSLAFESYFEVEVLYGDVKVPTLSSANIRPLGQSVPAPATTDVSSQRRDETSDVKSIPILFVAGDRGGSQRNQIQVPREFEAIQNALRACQHRDAMSLATPILAATHEKIAEAYRQRPTILHFAGHGDQRTLSVIQDQGALVTEIPLEAASLVKILANFPERIRLCVLNACDSGPIAQRLVQDGAVDAAVGWPSRVADSAAITFSSTLYGCLGDGIPLANAVRLAAEACQVEPVIYSAASVNLEQSMFVKGNDA